MGWWGYVAHVGEKRYLYRFWVRKPEGRKRLERCRPRYWDNIKIDIKEMGGIGMDWSGPIKGKLRGCYEWSNDPSDSINYAEWWGTSSFSMTTLLRGFWLWSCCRFVVYWEVQAWERAMVFECASEFQPLSTKVRKKLIFLYFDL